MQDQRMPQPQADGNQRSVRLRQIRVLWLPLLLVAVNALLVIVTTIIVLLALPLILTGLLVIALLRATIVFLSGGRWLARKRAPRGCGGTGTGWPHHPRRDHTRGVSPALSPGARPLPRRPSLGPPYRADNLAHIAGADYHPRAIELFLEHVRLRQGRTQYPDLPDLTNPALIRTSLGTPR